MKLETRGFGITGVDGTTLATVEGDNESILASVTLHFDTFTRESWAELAKTVAKAVKQVTSE